VTGKIPEYRGAPEIVADAIVAVLPALSGVLLLITVEAWGSSPREPAISRF
jgi:hypothetical protein